MYGCAAVTESGLIEAKCSDLSAFRYTSAVYRCLLERTAYRAQPTVYRCLLECTALATVYRYLLERTA